MRLGSAFTLLAKEFGWTPAVIKALPMKQIEYFIRELTKTRKPGGKLSGKAAEIARLIRMGGR